MFKPVKATMLSGPLYGLLFVVSLFTVASLGTGCNDNPSQIGDQYLPQNIKFVELDLPLSEFSITSGIAAASNSSNELNDAMLVGRANDGTIAHGLLALVDKSDLLRDISPEKILKAELRLRTFNYRYGDTASRQMAFDVASIEGVFGSKAQWSNDLAANVASGILIGSYNSTYPDSSMISVELTPERTAEFLNSYFRVDTVVSGPNDTVFQTVTLRTLALRAQESGSMIGSFLGTTLTSLPDSVRPTMRITLSDTVLNLRMGVSNWITQYPSTFETGPNKIAIGGGPPVRTHIQFRLDSIPNGVVIHRAELTLHINPTLTRRGTTSPTQRVIAYIAGDNVLDPATYLATSPAGLGQIFLRGARPARDDDSLEDKIIFVGFGTTVKQWLSAERNIGNTGTSIKNNGLILSIDRSLPNLESGTVDRLGFYGLDAPEALRPQLKIIYSTQTDA